MYILASLVSAPTKIRIPKQLHRKVHSSVEPQRILLAMLMLPDTGGSQKRRTRGINDIFVRAVGALVPISKSAALKGKAAREYIEEHLYALPEEDRIPALVCVAYALHGMMEQEETEKQVWKEVLLAVEAIANGRTPPEHLHDLGEQIAEGAMKLCT